MSLQSGLAVWLYTPLYTSASPSAKNYGREVQALRFNTLAPGGYGDFSCMLHFKDTNHPRPEIGLFTRIAVMAGLDCLWLGEVSEPALTMSTSDGEFVSITGLGIGNCLRDDPISIAYSNQTVQQIAIDQMTRGNRPNFLTVSQDTSGLFPDNPAGGYTVYYDGRNMEEVFLDCATNAGDYQFMVLAYANQPQGPATQRDSLGYPAAQVQIHLRDITTTHYLAEIDLADVEQYGVSQSAERAYNVIEIGYQNQFSGYGIKTATDSRLAANGSIGTAPYRRRKFRRDLSGISTINGSQSQTLANTYLSLFQNAPNKGTMTLKRIRDANGQPLDLYRVQADKNVGLTKLATRGLQIPLSGLTPGQDQFYIVKAEYSEDQQNQQLTLDIDNFFDSANVTIARQQLKADQQSRSSGTNNGRASLGAIISGQCGVQGTATSTNPTLGHGATFPILCAQVPSSIGFTADSGNNNAGTPAANHITSAGFYLSVPVNGTGGSYYCIGFFQYTTNGNCIRAIDEAAKTFAWHCDGCDAVHAALEMENPAHLAHLKQPGGADGSHVQHALSIRCPGCGYVEALNMELSAADEEEEVAPGVYHPQRAEQARLIRRLMRARGIELRL